MNQTIEFPTFQSKRCLMMPYVQGRPESVPESLRTGYESILEDLAFEPGQTGWLTIDESVVQAGSAHRGDRSKHGRALHTEVNNESRWGGGSGGGWGKKSPVYLTRDTRILVASSLGGTTAVWDAEQTDTTEDGDIGHLAHLYPMETAKILSPGEVVEFGIFTPHESLPVAQSTPRQFIRIIGQGVSGREDYFTINPLMAA
jgi:hypothetical protein